MEIGDKVRVVRCTMCTKVIGRVVTIKSKNEDGLCQLNFGQGRPNKGRPEHFHVNDLERVENEEGEE